MQVLKRSGERQAFSREKLVMGMASAAKGRPIAQERFEALADEIEDAARGEGAVVSSEWVGLAVLERLRRVDTVACLRFASVYKDFDDVGDFERELSLIKIENP